MSTDLSAWGVEVCRDRVKRAGEIRDEIGRVWDAYIATPLQPKAFDLVPGDVDGQWTLVLATVVPMPNRVSTLFGEWLYLLRAALDGFAYHLAVRDSEIDPPPNERLIYFPIKETAEKYDNLNHRANLRALSDETFARLREFQPFNSPAGPQSNWLWWIEELARSDRHRRGHVLAPHATRARIGTWGPLSDMKFRLPGNNPVPLEESGPMPILDLRAPVHFNKGQVAGHMRIKDSMQIVIDVTGWRADAPPPMNSYDLGDRMHFCEKHVLVDIIGQTTDGTLAD